MIDRIKQILAHYDNNQKELADKIGVSTGNITEWFKGRSKPKTESIVKICEVFNINANWLLTGTGEMFLTDQPESGECPNCKELQKVVDKLESNLAMLKDIIKEACAHNHLAEKKITG